MPRVSEMCGLTQITKEGPALASHWALLNTDMFGGWSVLMVLYIYAVVSENNPRQGFGGRHALVGSETCRNVRTWHRGLRRPKLDVLCGMCWLFPRIRMRLHQRTTKHGGWITPRVSRMRRTIEFTYDGSYLAPGGAAGRRWTLRQAIVSSL